MRHERIHRADVETQLARALVTLAAEAGLDAIVEDHRARPWASATFVGAQHALILVVNRSPSLGSWLATLADATFTLRGHIFASLAVDRVDDNGAVVRVALAVLTLEDG